MSRPAPNEISLPRFLAYNALLACVYAGAGWLGLMLAVPPGYATIIWPASGFAFAGLLYFGPRLSPGVFLGSFVVNALVGQSLGADGLNMTALAIAVCLACGATLQALIASLAVRRLFGLPCSLANFQQGVLFTLIIGPIGCIVAATVGVTTLFVAGALASSQLWGNWVTWWMGDLIGMVVIVPLALFAPWRPWSLQWRGQSIVGLKLASMIIVLIPIGLTFYAWTFTTGISHQKAQSQFAELADENLLALVHRTESYTQALRGAAGLLQASDDVSLREWRIYVETHNIDTALPGISGIGFIKEVANEKLDAFLAEGRAKGIVDFDIHPKTPTPANFIIQFIEPAERNRAAVGLNIAFEPNRYLAATRARDWNVPTITQRIFLVQDETHSAGFLLLRPVYWRGMPAHSLAERRAAFRGWVYAPFVGKRFLAGLTSTQGKTLNLEVFDGDVADRDELIYDSGTTKADTPSNYVIEKTQRVLGQPWTFRWTSTPEFEASTRTNEAELVLGSGLLLSGLFGIYLLSLARREQKINDTVEKQTRKIAAKEEQNRSVVNTALVAIILFDETGKALAANAAAERIFGFETGEMAGVLANTIFHNGNEPDIGEPLAWLMSTHGAYAETDAGNGKKERSTIVANRRDGTKRYLNLQLSPWITETGERRFTAVVRDVTEQRKVTIALEEAEERWSTALKGADIGVFDIDLVEGKSIVSDTWRTMLGFSADDDISAQSEWLERVHPDDLQRVLDSDQACFDGRAARSETEYRIRRKDDRWVWIRSDATVTERDANGEPLRMVGTQSDITDLKSAEALLKASQERLQSAIENAPIGMALVDLDGAWLKVNDALCSILGYSHDGLLGTTFQEITFADDLDLDMQHVDKLLSGQVQTYQLEKRYVHKDGHAIWCLLSVSLARDEYGAPEYFISQIQNIDDRKQMDRLKGEFISNVSHELRTPLTSIRGSLGLITGAMVEGIPDNVLRLLTIAHKNSERLILLINDILDMEKLAADKVPFDLEAVDLVDQARQAVEANQGYAEQFDVRFVLTAPDAQLIAKIDASRVQQILANLMSNAAKFSAAGDVVDVSVSEQLGRVRVAVRDRGPGIPPSFKNAIFAPFSQADGSATRKKGGTGLGLHISKQFAERMGGVVDYESVEGEGAVFWVEFPCIADTHTSNNPKQLSGPRILHVEDDADFSAFLAAALGDKATMHNAATLKDARNTFADDAFDLLVLDVQLPDGNGLSLLDEIPPNWQTPIVVVTAVDNLAPDPRVYAALIKSKTPEAEIISVIQNALAMVADEANAQRKKG